MSTFHRSRQRGVTLIELMVALTIGLFLTMAVTSIIVITLRQQRMSASVNERDQTAIMAMAQLDKSIRSAGSSLSNSWDLGFFGCQLRAAKSGAQLLPGALPAPFNTTSLSAPVVAPVLIDKGAGGNGSDVLFVLGGNSTSGDVPRYLRSVSSQTLGLENVIGMRSNDLMIIAAEGFGDCYVTQINTVTATANTLGLGGAYYVDQLSGASHSLADLVNSKSGYAAPIGNAGSPAPLMELLGVGSNDVLFKLDMLHVKTGTPQAIADGVSHLFALYGIDSNLDGKVDTWVDPGSAQWNVAAMKADPKKIRQIMAVRVAIVTHSRSGNQAHASPPTIDVFTDLDTGLQRQITLSSAQQSQRYKVTDTIIPLRNNLLIEP